MRRSYLIGLTLAAFACGSGPASAETMSDALARAYSNNPDINQQRASVRATDETVPQAKAGWLPKVQAQGTLNYQVSNVQNVFGQTGSNQKLAALPITGQAQVTENVFDGMQTANRVNGAESSVLAAREQLRLTELTTLQNGATAYMDVLRDTAVLGLRRNNVKVLKVQLQQTRDRFQVGEVTRTDVAQAESSLATGTADVSAAEARLQASIAAYRQVIGVQPKRLQPARPVEKLLPRTLDLAIATGLSQHPSIIGALHQVDVAEDAVKVAEGALSPQLSVVGMVQNSTDSSGYPGYNVFSATVGGQLTVPIYQGGAEYAGIREAKEKLSQARMVVESARNQIRAGVVAAWGELEAARAQIVSFEAAVKAAEIALTGVREEAKVGQRTTLDVLNAEQTLLQQRVQLVQAQHDRVVGSYAVMAAIGELSARNLGLGVIEYSPRQHYQATKNRFFGINTPDGR
ncbi:TolC family outer membrane protein [Rhodoblastus acidophilus]|uniref:TolC family outer membrane protein n=1 Tax=Candidatus Rhodoblastus alkanivorans TaxID=2954117 RepID=A0ABS9Z8A9_9HYPH|nr:TolC family outer membrane protein [Candidatus Rhodoblastus alkanivorans]MCI4677936.1 TolC family outer membrane protein [Candidatus Rhodoblastus alkanivorans]MCI4683831.1 TolC family outer membrane protein [Candidatus Rhodoblastus alkanivorans]MDI4641149.1 TolC family outer membrane protein [Rhodoblastus acidophilus]